MTENVLSADFHLWPPRVIFYLFRDLAFTVAGQRRNLTDFTLKRLLIKMLRPYEGVGQNFF